MFFRRRYPNSVSAILVLGGLFLLLLMIKKMKFLYDVHQKYYRLESYKQYMDEVSEYMKNVEVSANKSSNKVHRLAYVLQQQREENHFVPHSQNSVPAPNVPVKNKS